MSIVHRQQVNIVVTLLSVIEHISVLNNYTNTWRGLSVMCLNIGIVTCGPNEALIISGLFQSTEGTLVVGGRAIVLPGTILMWFKLNIPLIWRNFDKNDLGFQTLQRIPLNTMTLSVSTKKVYTSQGVGISVVGTAQVKINGSSEDMLRY